MAIAASYLAADQFTVAGDRQAEFHVGRRVRAECGVDGDKYGTIAAVGYAAPNTTITLSEGSDDLTANLSGVLYAEVGRGATQSLPMHSHNGNEGEGGQVDHSNLNDDEPTKHLRTIISTEDPSGTNWDVWLKYEVT